MREYPGGCESEDHPNLPAQPRGGVAFLVPVCPGWGPVTELPTSWRGEMNVPSPRSGESARRADEVPLPGIRHRQSLRSAASWAGAKGPHPARSAPPSPQSGEGTFSTGAGIMAERKRRLSADQSELPAQPGGGFAFFWFRFVRVGVLSPNCPHRGEGR